MSTMTNTAPRAPETAKGNQIDAAKCPEFWRAIELHEDAARRLLDRVEFFRMIPPQLWDKGKVVDLFASGLLLAEIIRDYTCGVGEESINGSATSLVGAIGLNLDLAQPGEPQQAEAVAGGSPEPVSASPAPEPRETPRRDEDESSWYNSTPNRHEYWLSMYGDEGVTIEVVDMSRAEYIMLKRVLAEHRGIKHDLGD